MNPRDLDNANISPEDVVTRSKPSPEPKREEPKPKDVSTPEGDAR